MGVTPTTKAQVSGHKFLLRRMEHGLILGDIRMIHDPFAKRQRALVFGLAACALIALGAVALAVLKPAADPGTAKIIQSDSGQLYVRVDDTLHPVANLASARLIAGEAAQPKKASDVILHELPKTQPVGIIDAPGVLGGTADLGSEFTAYACQDTTAERDPQRVIVAIEERSRTQRYTPLSEKYGVIAVADDTEWLVTAAGRRRLPSADTPDGRMVRRQFGIDAATPRWKVSPQVLSAVVELPEVAVPAEITEVLHTTSITGTDYWARTPDGLVALSLLQADVLIDAGRPLVSATVAELNGLPDDSQKRLNSLPESVPQWRNPADYALCVGNDGLVATVDPQWEAVVPLEVAGLGASHFVGPGWAIGVETGYGVHVISDTGMRHQVENPDAVQIIGLAKLHSVNWDILRLLPEGTKLERSQALKPLVR